MNLTLTLPSVAYQVIRQGNWPNDNPRGWLAIEDGTWRKVGVGRQFRVVMDKADAEDLADYLLSVADVNEVMSAGEREGSRDGRTTRLVAERIKAVLP